MKEMGNTMVNEDKIKLMTKLATYEKREGKNELPIMQYFQGDYIIYNTMKTVISTTIAYIMIVGMICLVKGQYLMENIHKMSLEDLAGRVIFGYIITEAFYITVALIVYIRKYHRAQTGVKEYFHWLKQLKVFYKDR